MESSTFLTVFSVAASPLSLSARLRRLDRLVRGAVFFSSFAFFFPRNRQLSFDRFRFGEDPPSAEVFGTAGETIGLVQCLPSTHLQVLIDSSDRCAERKGKPIV